MKTFRLFAALMMAVVCVSLSSCSKDDDESNPVDNSLDISLLYGKWEREYLIPGTSTQKDVFTFKSDGTWSKTMYNNGVIGNEEKNTFIYYKDTRVLEMKGNPAYIGTEGYTIIELTDKTLIWLVGKNLHTYTRQK